MKSAHIEIQKLRKKKFVYTIKKCKEISTSVKMNKENSTKILRNLQCTKKIVYTEFWAN